mgnify:CR=1 FL=1
MGSFSDFKTLCKEGKNWQFFGRDNWDSNPEPLGYEPF